ncbi:MAG: tyrosine-protein phosphatase [Acidimicrobiia bacterium]
MTTTFDRHLPLSGAYNVRDAGGYTTADGGQVRWRTLLRADALHRVDPSELGDRHGVVLRTQLDLRRPVEIEKAPSALRQLTGMRYVNEPITGEQPIVLDGEWRLDRLYRSIIDDRAQAIGRAISALAWPGSFPVVVNCTAGKDRTGVVIALLLSIAGVADDDIVNDYALTSRYLVGDYTEIAAGQIAAMDLPEDIDNERGWHIVLGCEPELMASTLDYVRETYGSTEAYLDHTGVDAVARQSIRRQLVDAI